MLSTTRGYISFSRPISFGSSSGLSTEGVYVLVRCLNQKAYIALCESPPFPGLRGVVSALPKKVMSIPCEDIQVLSSQNAPSPSSFRKVRKSIVKIHYDASLLSFYILKPLNPMANLKPYVLASCKDLIPKRYKPRLEASSARRVSRRK